MKAQDNITYVVISANIVSQIFTKEDMSEWNEDNIHVLELSDYEKQWVEIGMQYDEATNSIVQPSLQEYKTKRIEFINTMFELESQSLKGELVAQDEQLSWSIQESEARAYNISKNPQDCPMLNTLSQARGIELEALVLKVLEKNTAYANSIATLIGYRQSLQDKIEACVDFKEVLNIQYISPLGLNQ